MHSIAVARSPNRILTLKSKQVTSSVQYVRDNMHAINMLRISDSLSFGSVITYRCSSPLYRLVGPKRRVCMADGIWYALHTTRITLHEM